MRFLKMVQCGCRAAQPEDIMLANQPVREVRSAEPDSFRRKRHRRVGPGKVSSGNWRPSLGDIIEDHDDQARKCSSAARSSAKPTGRAVPKSRKEDFRQMESPRNMSAYAPTAYLF